MGFKWVNCRKQFEKSNLTFCPETGRGYSYRWYRIVDNIGGKIVLNTYNYSRTTVGHIGDIKALLRGLEIKIDVEIEAPRGLSDHASIQRHYASMIDGHREKIAAKGSRNAKNQERQKIIQWLNQELARYNEVYASHLFDKEMSDLLSEEAV